MTESVKKKSWAGTLFLLIAVIGLGLFARIQFFSENPFFPMDLDFLGPRFSQAEGSQNQQALPEREEADQGKKTMTVNLFFAGPDLSELETEDRVIPLEPDPLAAASRAIEELLKGPSEFGLYPVCGKGVTLRTLFFRQGSVYVDFNRSIADGSWRSAVSEYIFLKALCRTLSNIIPDVNWVVVMVNGRQMGTMNKEDGHLDISDPFPADFQG